VAEVREVFAGFQIEPVSLNYTIAGGKGKPAREVIIASFKT